MEQLVAVGMGREFVVVSPLLSGYAHLTSNCQHAAASILTGMTGRGQREPGFARGGGGGFSELCANADAGHATSLY